MVKSVLPVLIEIVTAAVGAEAFPNGVTAAPDIEVLCLLLPIQMGWPCTGCVAGLVWDNRRKRVPSLPLR